ncbi:hypothetical protein Tco_0682252 [Tanacetum coccineum]|uniref:Reverse transcriptase Ty1/copia-type domain-containing protein n=1 Tax=Tanacetum coccineum TaxID=301880 RepID=A0ABQ4XRM8_9ASTR
MLASPEQTATGKDLSNPFMVVMTYQKSYSIQHTMIHVLSVEVVFSSPWIITFSRYIDPTLNTVSSPFNTVSSPLNTVGSTVNTVSSSFTTVDPGREKEQRNEYESLFDPLIPDLEDTADLQDTGIFGSAYDDEYVGAKADLNNLETTMSVSPIPTTRIHKDHPKAQIIREVDSAIEPKKVTQSLDDESWVEAMQEELLQFKLLNVWTLVDLPHGKKVIGTKWVFRNKRDQRGLKQSGFMDPEFPTRVYKVEKALYGLHQAPKSWSTKESLSLQVEQRKDCIFLSQDKYVYDILKKFGFSNVKTASTLMETHKPLSQDTTGTDVDVQPKASHTHAVKRIFRYLKGQPTLGLWYPKDSPMDLIVYSDSDYVGASIDRKSTTGGCQFLSCRLISWQCKKQTIVDNSTTEAKYIAASNCKSKEVRILRYLSLVVPLTKVGDEAVHKELGDKMEMGDKMERAATTASSFEAEQDSDAQTRFEAASKGPKIHLSQEVTYLKVGRTNLTQLSIHQMATLEFCDKHNLVAYLEKPEGSTEFHQIIDFQTASHIHYALTENPTIYASFIKQFWTTATSSTNVNGEVELTTSIDGQAKTITEASLRRHLKLEDNGGITSLPNTEIFEQLALMGLKKTSWEQFSSNIATVIICLTTNRTFNFSKFIFDAMVKNLDNPHKFLMYPRFIQICLNKQRRLLKTHTRTYPTPVLTHKVFNNMKRVTRGYSGDDIPLFSSMITAPDTSPSRITSSPSLSPQHTPVSAPSTSPPPITETSPTIEEPAPIPHESPLQSVHSLRRDEGSVSLNELMDLVTQLTNKVGGLENELKNTKKVYGTAITKLAKRVKKLEMQVKTGKASRRTKIVLSEDEAVEEDSSKQGRSLIEELDMDADISLVPPHAEIQEKISDETEVLLEEEEATKIVQDQGSGEKGEQEVSTAAGSLVYIRRSEKKKKDKGKAILIEDESVQKKSKKQEQEERLGHEEAIRLQEQINEEERKRIARDAEIAKQLQEEYDKAGKKEGVTEVDTAHVIDWNDPSVIRYHALQNRPRSIAEVRKNMMVYLKNQGGYKMKDFKGMSYDDIRPIFEKVWDQIHSFVPMDSEEEVPRLKRAGQDVETKPAKRQRTKESRQSHEIYQVFEDMLKNFDRDDMDKLWSLVRERYNSSGLAEDKKIELWVELKMLFEPDAKKILELQKDMHDPLNWWLYDTCTVHHVSTKKGQDIFMLVEKDYPLTKGLATLMLVNKLRVDQHSEMADELLTKIYNIANRPRN